MEQSYIDELKEKLTTLQFELRSIPLWKLSTREKIKDKILEVKRSIVAAEMTFYALLKRKHRAISVPPPSFL